MTRLTAVSIVGLCLTRLLASQGLMQKPKIYFQFSSRHGICFINAIMGDRSVFPPHEIGLVCMDFKLKTTLAILDDGGIKRNALPESDC